MGVLIMVDAVFTLQSPESDTENSSELIFLFWLKSINSELTTSYDSD